MKSFAGECPIIGQAAGEDNQNLHRAFHGDGAIHEGFFAFLRVDAAPRHGLYRRSCEQLRIRC